MENSISTNIILFDWLTASSPLEPFELIELLDLRSDVEFTARTTIIDGYVDGVIFGDISICWNNRLVEGSLLNMSGKGCRTFETYSNITWSELFRRLLENGCHVSRIDVAYDDHTGVFDLAEMCVKGEAGEFKSGFRSGHSNKPWYKNGGLSFELGSKKSDVFIRCYDKAKERGYTGDMHWVRFEIMVRDEHCLTFVESKDIGSTFKGVIKKYLNFLDPTGDSNKSRWPVSEFWSDFLGNVEAIKLYSAPGVEYNLSKLDHVSIEMFGSVFEAAIRIYGLPMFLSKLADYRKDKKLPLHYRDLISMHGSDDYFFDLLKSK